MKIFRLIFTVLCICVLSVTVRRHLDSFETARAVQMIEDGVSQRQVADVLGVSPSVVNRLWARYLETGTYTRRPGQGRPRATTERQDRYLRTLGLRHRQATARTLRNDFQQGTGVRLSDQTVRNRLHVDNLRSRRPATGPILTVDHRRHRLEYAHDHGNWQLDRSLALCFING